MGKQTIISRIKDFVANVSFNVLMWSLNTTAEDYWSSIYNQKKGE